MDVEHSQPVEVLPYAVEARPRGAYLRIILIGNLFHMLAQATGSFAEFYRLSTRGRAYSAPWYLELASAAVAFAAVGSTALVLFRKPWALVLLISESAYVVMSLTFLVLTTFGLGHASRWEDWLGTSALYLERVILPTLVMFLLFKQSVRQELVQKAE